MPQLIPSYEYRLGLTRNLCPTCGSALPSITIRGNIYQVVRRASIGGKHITLRSENGSTSGRCRTVPVIFVEMSRTAPPKEPLTEPRAGQP